MAMIDRNFTFATNGTVTANDLHNLIDSATIYQDLITGQQPITSVGTNYELLIADGTNPNAAPNAVTVYDLFEDALTAGTYTNANISAALTYGTATGTRLVSTNATITTGTITTAVIPALTAGTTTSTAATITSGTITNLASTTGTIGTLNSTTGTVATLNSTTGTIATLNSTTGTIGTLNSTTGTIATLNSTTGTIATLNSTTGTITTLNSTTGTIGNLSTTLAGDFTISQGTGTIGAAKVTPANLSQPFTSGTAVASTSGTAIDFTGIPSWVKRITVTLFNVSTNGASHILIQLGTSSGFVSSGYTWYSSVVYGTNLTTTAGGLTGLGLYSTAGNETRFANAQINNITGNTWVYSHSGGWGNGSQLGSTNAGGGISLSGTLDRLRVTTVNGTDTFDLGTINISYEG